MKRIQVYIAGLFALICLLALSEAVYLIFIFPKTLEIWADQGRSLSGYELLLANASDFCKTFGLLILPALALGLAGCIIWAGLKIQDDKKQGCNEE